MSLDIETMKALAGETTVSLPSARRYLDETGACADDLADATLKPLWAVLEDRIRRSVYLDAESIAASLKPTSVARATVFEVIKECELGVTQQRLEAFHQRGMMSRFESGLRDAVKAGRSGSSVAEVQALAARALKLLDGGKSRVRSAVGDAAVMRDHLEGTWSGQRAPALTTGFDGLDEVLGGLINNLIAIGAHPGVGKSSLVAGLIRNWANLGITCGLLAYEDDAIDAQARIVACAAGVSVKHTRGDIMANEEQKSAIHDALAWWSSKEHLLIVDDQRPAGTTAEVLASMRTMVARGARALILDNVKCVRMDGDDEKHTQVERALQDMRSLAQTLHVPVIAIGHLKRGQSDVDESRRPPKLSDFSASSAWETLSRVAIGLWVDGSGVSAKVLKQTNGPSGGEMTLVFAREAAVVTNIESRQAAPPKDTRRKNYSKHTEVETDS